MPEMMVTLPVPLDEAEVLRLALEMARVEQDLDSTREEKKATDADLGAKIKALQERVSELSRSVLRKEEVRQVLVRVEPGPGGLVRYVRADTGEAIDPEEIPVDERQILLGL